MRAETYKYAKCGSWFCFPRIGFEKSWKAGLFNRPIKFTLGVLRLTR